jgi:hypothetical protein
MGDVLGFFGSKARRRLQRGPLLKLTIVRTLRATKVFDFGNADLGHYQKSFITTRTSEWGRFQPFSRSTRESHFMKETVPP